MLERDLTFLYSGDARHFVGEDDGPPFLSIVGGTLIDGTGAAPRENPGLLLHDGVISHATADTSGPKPRVVDAKGRWIVPGLFDLHTHLTFYLPGGFHAEDDVLNALRTLKFLEYYQRIGVTTVFEVASRNNVGFSLKRGQRMGFVGGARLFVSGPAITVSGGHPTEFQPYEDSAFAVVGDGPWEMRKLVREAVRNGADFIKVLPPLTREELEAVVDEAHAWKLRVTSHVGGIQDLSRSSGMRSVAAGVDSVHHLYPYSEDDPALLRRMAVEGIPVIPTLAYHLREVSGSAHISNRWLETNIGHDRESVLATFRTMREAGLIFGVGTESNPLDMLRIGEVYAAELKALMESGLSPAEVIQAATLHSAEVMGMADDGGSIEDGKWADVLILDEDPLNDITALVRPAVVIQAGKIVYTDTSGE
ncbi:amidohydrolase family protein [Elongatibacter sediminis]|uniref:Amidohydrolase family protein n=1 Tax=Elongatibacter sediminis TaxID=3119006 RepID=A0AAW9RF27_9GAMM